MREREAVQKTGREGMVGDGGDEAGNSKVTVWVGGAGGVLEVVLERQMVTC